MIRTRGRLVNLDTFNLEDVRWKIMRDACVYCAHKDVGVVYACKAVRYGSSPAPLVSRDGRGRGGDVGCEEVVIVGSLRGGCGWSHPLPRPYRSLSAVKRGGWKVTPSRERERRSENARRRRDGFVLGMMCRSHAV